jgi:hypothetical protein
MTGEIEDERSFKRAMREAMGEVGREQIQEGVEDAVRFANDALRQVGESPPPDATLDEWHVQPIIDSVEVYWEQGESEGELAKGNALVAEWTHPHAGKIEMGVKPHTIEGDPILVFEWPNAPDEVREQFRSQWENPDSFLDEPEVAYAKVEHPGIPSVGFIRSGFVRSIKRNFE